MTALVWDDTGQRRYETGVDHGVLYMPDEEGAYTDGVAWNGLTTVTESPAGAEASPQYADNIKYLNLTSLETFGATVEAFTYPDEFNQFDGAGVPTPGMTIGQQARRPFGLSYRSKIGNDVDGDDHGFKLHLVYGCQAAPSEKAYGTVNDSPAAIAFSWALTTTPVAVGTLDGKEYKPTALITIDSTEVNAGALADLEDMLYGTVGQDPQLPLPADVYALFAGTVTEAIPAAPTYVSGTHTLTIPTVTGVSYFVNGEPITAGAHVITEDTFVTARPNTGYKFPPESDDDWSFDYS